MLMPIIVMLFFGALFGGIFVLSIQEFFDKKKSDEGFDERYANWCKIVDDRYHAQLEFNGRNRARVVDDDDMSFLDLPNSEEDYYDGEQEMTDRILRKIRPKLNEIETNTRYSSDHPTNIWRKE